MILNCTHLILLEHHHPPKLIKNSSAINCLITKHTHSPSEPTAGTLNGWNKKGDAFPGKKREGFVFLFRLRRGLGSRSRKTKDGDVEIPEWILVFSSCLPETSGGALHCTPIGLMAHGKREKLGKWTPIDTKGFLDALAEWVPLTIEGGVLLETWRRRRRRKRFVMEQGH